VCQDGEVNGCFSAGHQSVCVGGQWGGQACPADAPVCVEGECVKFCGSAPCCEPQARRCAGNQPQVCGEDGVWSTGQACGAEEALCAGGTCGRAVQLSLGKTHSCALTTGGWGYCWGLVPHNDGTQVEQLTPAALANVGMIKQIAAGPRHTCAILDGKVLCMGDNGQGQLGHDGVTQPVLSLPAASRVAVGDAFSCAAIESGAVYCWGARPGAPAASASMEPALVPGVDATGGLVAGASHACALGADGQVRCWGVNFSGQLGPQAPGQLEANPAPVAGLGKVQAIFAGFYGTCARGDDGLRCWGTVPGQPYEPAPLGAPAGATEVALGAGFVCALDPAAGELFCRPEGGEFAKIPLSGAAVQVSAGEGHACAALGDGRVECWGANDSGQLGLGKLSPAEPPSQPAW